MGFYRDQEKLRKACVLFVCTGNICRSPTAHGVFSKLVQDQSLQHFIEVDSAGTHAYHTGERPDPRATAAAAKRGYDLKYLRARKIDVSDFAKYEYILAMDNQNMKDLLKACINSEQCKIQLFMNFAQTRKHIEVPDPYYGTQKGFEVVLDLIEDACSGLLEYIRKHHALASTAGVS